MVDLYKKLSKERKELQDSGEVPEWFTTAGWQLFKDKYQYQGQSYKGTCERIAKCAAKHVAKHGLDVQEWETKFYNLLWKGWLSPSTPVLSNMGTSKGMNVSCSGTYVSDSVYGFYDSFKENAILTKHGFGTSGYLSDIRPRGSKIATGGKASGITPVLKHFVFDMQTITQGTQRRGAFAGYIDIEHKDFYEIADLIQHEPDDLNIGWIVKDKFIKKLQNGDKEANNRFKKAMKSKLLTGKGYFFFVDKVNRNRPKMYKDKNLDVKASNLCVAPETLILTKFGYLPIVELEDKTIDVWNGEEWSTTTIRKTGTNQELVKVITDSGQELECTQYHKFYIKDRSAEYSNRIVEVSASELKRGDKLIKFELPVIDGELTLTNAYQNGFYSGDGCLVKNNSRIYLYGEKRNLLNYFPNRRLHTIQDDYDREYFYYDNLKPKFYIPTSDYSIDSRVQWLAGLFDADGCVINVNGSLTLQLVSTNKEFLKELQLMLQTLGVTSKIKFTREQGLYKLPANDGSDELKDFQCNAQYRILLSGNGLLQLKELGFNTNRLKIDGNIPNRNAERFIQIVDVEYNNRISDTYCFTEHKRHMGMFNGILTGQCAEIALHSSEEYSFSCVLSAMNLYWYDDWKDTTAVFDATVFLDCVAEEFITLAENIKGLEKTVDFTRKGRALGLGVCGFHTYLQEKRWPFEGLEAHTWNNQVFKHIRTEADKASKWMATVMGEPEWCAGYGVRNTHLMALMPTKACVSENTEIFVDDELVSYKTLLCNNALQDITDILIDLEDGSKKTLKYNDSINVIRNNNTITIFAYQLMEGDDLI